MWPWEFCLYFSGTWMCEMYISKWVSSLCCRTAGRVSDKHMQVNCSVWLVCCELFYRGNKMYNRLLLQDSNWKKDQKRKKTSIYFPLEATGTDKNKKVLDGVWILYTNTQMITEAHCTDALWTFCCLKHCHFQCQYSRFLIKVDLCWWHVVLKSQLAVWRQKHGVCECNQTGRRPLSLFPCSVTNTWNNSDLIWRHSSV